MLRGHHGNGLAQDVAPVLEAALADVGKVPENDVALDGRKAQPLVGHVILAHALGDGGGHDVAWLQFVGKATVVAVEQNGALTAAALGDEKRPPGLGREQPRGVDLHVVEVLARDTMLRGDVAGVTRELREVRRVVVHATNAARGPQRARRVNRKRLGAAELVCRRHGLILVHRGAAHAHAARGLALALDEYVRHGDVLEDAHVGQAAHGREQPRRDLAPGDVGVEGDAWPAVRTLAREVERPVLASLEVHAQRDKVVDDRAARADHDVHALAAVLVMTGAQGISEERLVVLGLGEHADAALGEHGGALVHVALREHDDVGARGQVERCVQPGHATARDHDVTAHILVCLLGHAAHLLTCAR